MDMLKIVICDDDKTERNDLENKLKRYFNETPSLRGTIYTASSKEEVETIMETKEIDLFILDIVMNGDEEAGIAVAEMIRERNDDVPIMFVSSFDEYAFDAYSVKAFRYYKKPILPSEIDDSISRVRRGIKEKRQKCIVSTKDGLISVYSYDVMYVENIARSTVYYLRNGETITVSGSREPFEKRVEVIEGREEFIHPHKSYFVNMNDIKLFLQETMILDNGKEIPISRKRYSDVKKAYLQFAIKQGTSI